MSPAITSSMREAIVRVAASTPGLGLLLLYGSRARGDSRPGSDWDFAYLAAPALDHPGLHATLVETVGRDGVDLADLGRAGGLLRYRAARDGVRLYEARTGIDARFRFEATRFWCEAAPVLQHGYRDVLAALTP
jgi:predicted nucleotidyltransferase